MGIVEWNCLPCSAMSQSIVNDTSLGRLVTFPCTSNPIIQNYDTLNNRYSVILGFTSLVIPCMAVHYTMSKTRKFSSSNWSRIRDLMRSGYREKKFKLIVITFVKVCIKLLWKWSKWVLAGIEFSIPILFISRITVTVRDSSLYIQYRKLFIYQISSYNISCPTLPY